MFLTRVAPPPSSPGSKALSFCGRTNASLLKLPCVQQIKCRSCKLLLLKEGLTAGQLLSTNQVHALSEANNSIIYFAASVLDLEMCCGEKGTNESSLLSVGWI